MLTKNRMLLMGVLLGLNAISFTGVLAPVSVARADQRCSCPLTFCETGSKVEGCSVECPTTEDAVCICASFCDPNGNASGINTCKCQPKQQ